MNKRKKEITPQLNSTLESGYTTIWCVCYTGLVYKHVEKVHYTLSNKINFPLPNNLCPSLSNKKKKQSLSYSQYPFSLFFYQNTLSHFGKKVKGVGIIEETWMWKTKCIEPQPNRRSLQNIRNLFPELIKQINLCQNGSRTKFGFNLLPSYFSLIFLH